MLECFGGTPLDEPFVEEVPGISDEILVSGNINHGRHGCSCDVSTRRGVWNSIPFEFRLKVVGNDLPVSVLFGPEHRDGFRLLSGNLQFENRCDVLPE